MHKKTKIRTIEYNPIVPPERAHGYKGVRWVENVSRGLRLVGFADEIARKQHSRSVEHKGWFTDEDIGEVYRGIVYQLPSRDQLPSRQGVASYVYGYADPNNDDCALLCFDPETDELDAARAADRFAECFAEQERDYQEAWRAGRRCEDLSDEVVTLRRDALAIGEEMRAAKRAKLDAPTICGTLRARIRSMYREIQKMRKERDELIDTFGQRPGFVE